MTTAWSVAVLLLFVLGKADGADPPRVALQPSYGWANLAWGWNEGGRERSIENRKVLIMDLDESESTIREKVARGHLVFCYFSVGSTEPWRQDIVDNKDEWDNAAVGNMREWDEKWLDVTKLETLKGLMEPRFELARTKGCNGVEPDNIDCFDNVECYGNIAGKTQAQVKAAQIAYNKWQAETAHSKGLAILMKNALDLINAETVAAYDGAMNEECQMWDECDMYQPFIEAGKWIANIEYRLNSVFVPGLKTKYCKGSDGICNNNRDGSKQYWVDLFGDDVVTPPSPVPPTPAPIIPTPVPSTPVPS
eukprot:Sspe_Gene.108425::Locus_87545_Transcript_1_1_Confidence_1.000_Length_947::g.108425::m.108425